VPDQAASIGAQLARTAAARPQGRAVVDGDVTLTWAELDAAATALAGSLLARGLAPGDRVGLALPNGAAFAVGYLGALRAGLVVLPVNTQYTAPEVAHLLGDVGAALLVVPAEGGEAARAAAAEVGVDLLEAGSGSWEAVLAGTPDAPPLPEVGPADLAVVVYTSGTSGRPKGAMLTHGALLANTAQLLALEPPVVSAEDRLLVVLPLFHIYALSTGLGMAVATGATAVLADRFEPVQTLALLAQEQVTVVLGAPPMYVAWSLLPDLAERMASVRLAITGAAPLPASVREQLTAATGHAVFNGYGLTETAPVLTTTLAGAGSAPDSIGRPLPGVEVRLLDEAGDEVEEDDAGEITVRGANLFEGYWPDRREGPDEQGWWRTGDVAYADAHGDLHLVDRRRELILVSGFNVYPREVEDVLVAHPAITEAAVVGIPHPYTGESVKAYVVPRRGQHVTADEVIAWAARSLARFKCPTTVEVVSSLPHSTTGKVSKGRLRALAAERAGSPLR